MIKLGQETAYRATYIRAPDIRASRSAGCLGIVTTGEPPALLGPRTGTAARETRCEVSTDRVHDGVARARAPAFGNQLLQIPRVRYVAEFDQHRGHIGRLENPEAGRPLRTLVQARRGAHVLDHIAGELSRKCPRLPLREIDENVRDLVGCGGKINARYDIRPVLGIG